VKQIILNLSTEFFFKHIVILLKEYWHVYVYQERRGGERGNGREGMGREWERGNGRERGGKGMERRAIPL
jgi:hypothetical protein